VGVGLIVSTKGRLPAQQAIVGVNVESAIFRVHLSTVSDCSQPNGHLHMQAVIEVEVCHERSVM
jgi:hypothetical protein